MKFFLHELLLSRPLWEPGLCPRLAGIPQAWWWVQGAFFSLVFSPGDERAVTIQCCPRPPAPHLWCWTRFRNAPAAVHTPFLFQIRDYWLLLSSYAAFENSELPPLSEPFNPKNPPRVAISACGSLPILHSRVLSGDSLHFDLLFTLFCFSVISKGVRR